MSCKCKIVPYRHLFFIYLLLRSCNSTSIITSDTPLSDDGNFLVSERKNFALGFFSPDNTSSRRYVGIWFYKVSIQAVVWVANRDNPIKNKSGVLSLDRSSGNLVLFDRQKPDVFIWSTNISNLLANVNSNHSAELLDSGNFVVHADDGSKEFLWQSFDFPTDTLLPGMKLGVDYRSGLNRFLTSWKSSDNPEVGSYTYMIDANASVPQLFLYKNNNPHWRAGPWNGLRWTGIPELTSNYYLNASYVDTPEEVSVTYSKRDPSIISRLVVNESTGTIQRLMWHQDNHTWFNFWSSPGEQCDYFNHCGAFTNCNLDNGGNYECKCLPGFEPKSPQDWYLRDSSQGCVRKQERQVCGNGEGFIKLERVKLPDTTKARLDMNLDYKACEDLCLKNCSCTGYSAANVSGGSFKGCITYYNELVDLREYPSSGQDFYLRADAIELANYSKKKKRSHVKIKVLVIVPSAAVLALLTLAYWLIMKKKKRGVAQRRLDAIELFTSNKLHRPQMGEEINEMGTSTVDMKLYPLSTIIAATENFSPAHKIGEGGFGSVYKGKLHNGQEIAVKRLSNTSGQGIEEFRNEVTLIAKLQHKNLVRLFGYCIHKEEKMLIYEYLPNRGLDCFLFDNEKKYMLDWRKRFDIALGIARGMVYLHHDSRLRIIHRDLKASNVLLDCELNPKISDFGMARIFGGDQLQETTKRVVGTYGYMAPEYAMGGHFSIKSDVFSFGVLLLEIVIGRKNSTYHTENSINLIGHFSVRKLLIKLEVVRIKKTQVWDLWRESKVSEIVDQSIGELHEHGPKILRCIHVGLLCVQESAKARPSMSEVVYMLCNDTSLPPPGQAAFVLRTSDKGSTNTSYCSVGANSVNEVTISTVEGR